MPETILVTSALPYANGNIHFGHIAGAYLPADVYVRFQRLAGADVIYICGTDEHGYAITVSAREAGSTPRDHVDRYHREIARTFELFHIEFDNFSRTTLPRHYALSQKFFTQIRDNGFISDHETEQMFCRECGLFLADRYVVGTCPKCGHENARGDECTNCGSWLEPQELGDARCKIHGTRPEVRPTRHWFLRLDKFSQRLREWLGEKKNWKPNVRNFVQGLLDQGLRPRPITRDMDWGVPVPLEEARGKVLYVWFDAPIGYISSTVEWAEKTGDPEAWKRYWQNPQCKLVHFIGKDNLPFHCIVWPAMLMGQDAPYVLPAEIPANEFYNLEGRQFSKSAGWTIELDDFFDRYSADSIRYAIAANAPETKDSDFSWKDFQKRHNDELADTLGNFVNRTLRFAQREFANAVPPCDSPGPAEAAMRERIRTGLVDIAECYRTFQLRRACFTLMELARAGNRYFDEKAPWKSRKQNPADCARTIHLCLGTIKALALAAYPVVPASAASLWRMLGLGAFPARGSWEQEAGAELPGGHTLGPSELMFTKIEDSQIQAEIDKLHAMVKSAPGDGPAPGAGIVPGTAAPTAAGGPPANAGTPRRAPGQDGSQGAAGLVSVDEFFRSKLVVARIVAAEAVAKSEKLVKLQIDLGGERRQIVAGIREYYREPPALVGRLVVVVANLRPARIMGIESQGMLLAARGPGGLFLVGPDGEAAPGAEVG